MKEKICAVQCPSEVKFITILTVVWWNSMPWPWQATITLTLDAVLRLLVPQLTSMGQYYMWWASGPDRMAQCGWVWLVPTWDLDLGSLTLACDLSADADTSAAALDKGSGVLTANCGWYDNYVLLCTYIQSCWDSGCGIQSDAGWCTYLGWTTRPQASSWRIRDMFKILHSTN